MKPNCATYLFYFYSLPFVALLVAHAKGAVLKIILSHLKMALYSIFSIRGIGVNGASVRVFKRDFYFDDITKNNGF